MPGLLLELFCEEIPARMQVRGAEDLARLVGEALAPLAPRDVRRFSGPRRIALAAELAEGVAETRQSERGPRLAAPEQALAGFLRKHGASREELREEGAFWVLDRAAPGIEAATLIARELPGVLRRFSWPKSMRWGGSSAFTWVRPLRRILCILDGEVVRFDLRHGEDDGHGLVSGDVSEGHRFMAPGAFRVDSAAQWQAELRARFVIADATERRDAIASGVARAASAHGLSVVPDAGLLDEVTGLVEWPVPLLGRIDAAFMDLPPEVMQVSMRVNQRYFALRDADGAAAARFAFVANVAADDGGAAIVAGNERVLRARFSDARHFWDLDRRTRLIDRVPALDSVTFHAKLGSQGDRVRRIRALASHLWNSILGAPASLVDQAALLAKADLTTGMVAEFPELQGTMGFYYASPDVEYSEIAEAVRDHYSPRGPEDTVPRAPLSVTVALADKLDMLASFFAIGEKPTGSGDPFALRRAALGVIRILRENSLRLHLLPILHTAGAGAATRDLLAFIFDRLRVQLRIEGARHDVLQAVLSRDDDDVVLALRLTDAVAETLETVDGANLLSAYRRIANLLRIEEGKGGVVDCSYDAMSLMAPEEIRLHEVLKAQSPSIALSMSQELYQPAMQSFAALRRPIDNFFDCVTVNDPDPLLRRNRLGLLAAIRSTMHRVADFSKIEG